MYVCIYIYRQIDRYLQICFYNYFYIYLCGKLPLVQSGSSEGINYKYIIELRAIEQLVNIERVFWHDKVKAIFKVSCLENPMDGGAWQAVVHGVAKSLTRLSDFAFTFHFHALEKEMATHSSVLAWRIPGTGEPGGLPSVGSHRVGHD